MIKVGVSRGGRMTELDKRIYRAAARAAVTTGVPILTHLAIDAEPAVEIFREEGLPLDRVLFGHADDGPNHGKTRHEWIFEQGGRIGFDTFGYETELEDPPFWARARKERMDHFMRLVDGGHLDQLLVSADANCSALGWPGVKGHTVNYIFEVMVPDMRAAGLDDASHRPAPRRPAGRLPHHPQLAHPTAATHVRERENDGSPGPQGNEGRRHRRWVRRRLRGQGDQPHGCRRSTVYEQAAQIGEVGAGIGLRPSSMDQFRQWGIFDAIAAVSSAERLLRDPVG